MIRHFIIAAVVVQLAACAHAPAEPVVDMRGVDPVNYQADLAECRGYAQQVDVGGNTAVNAGVGALVGAALGVAVGAVFHAPAAGAALGASSGAFGAGTGAAAASLQRQNTIEFNCLRNRGYVVLG